MFFGPEIVKENLVFYFDALNSKSYRTSETGWFDLAGNNHGTQVGSPTFSNEYGGGVYFDGSVSYFSIANDLTTMDFSLAQTICMWIKPDTGANLQRRNPYNQAYGGSGTLTRETNGTINYYFGTTGTDSGTNNSTYMLRNSVFTVSENELAFIAVTRSQVDDICRWYKNGNLVQEYTAGGFSATTNSTTPILIGDGYVQPWLGHIYNCMVYNSFLTGEQIARNFDSKKLIFGY